MFLSKLRENHARVVAYLFAFLYLANGTSSARVRIYLDADLQEPLTQTDFSTQTDCQLLPDITKGRPIFVLSDTCVKFHTSSNCSNVSGKSMYVHTGSNSVGYTKLEDGFDSYEPCSQIQNRQELENAASVKLNTKIFRSVLKLKSEQKPTYLSIVPESVIPNRGKNPLDHKFDANTTFTDFIKVHRLKWIKDVSTVSSNTNWRVEMERYDPENQFGPFINQVYIHSHIEKAFKDSKESGTLYSYEQPRNFKMNETIHISACSSFRIGCTLIVNYWRFLLESYVEVTGLDDNGQRISAETLKYMLPEGLWYKHTWDKFTVHAVSFDAVETEYAKVLEMKTDFHKISCV